jgi:hypothetical protein
MPLFLQVSPISLALLEGNLMLLFSTGGNTMRERKGRQEEKKYKRAGQMKVARGAAWETGKKEGCNTRTS